MTAWGLVRLTRPLRCMCEVPGLGHELVRGSMGDGFRDKKKEFKVVEMDIMIMAYSLLVSC